MLGDAPGRFRVRGGSMRPTLEDGQVALLMPAALYGGRLRRGDVVVFRQLTPPWGWLVKRIVGLPGEAVALSGGRLWVDDRPVGAGRLAAGPEGRVEGRWWNGVDEYFVLGDNPGESSDSRAFGPVPGGRIGGRVWLRVWPPGAWGRVG